MTERDRLAADLANIRRAVLRADLHRRYLAATSDDERDFLWREIRSADRQEDRIAKAYREDTEQREAGHIVRDPSRKGAVHATD